MKCVSMGEIEIGLKTRTRKVVPLDTFMYLTIDDYTGTDITEDNLIVKVRKKEEGSIISLVDVYVYASSHTLYCTNGVNTAINRYWQRLEYGILRSIRLFKKEEVPLTINWKWMSKQYKREFFGM